LSRDALDAPRRAADVGMRCLRRYLTGDAIRLLLENIGGVVDPPFRLRPHCLVLAALCAFAGKIGSFPTARALALKQAT
jgi:hypothetical protein